MLSNPAVRSVRTARRTSSGVARRSSTSSRCGRKLWAPSEIRVTPFSRRSATSSGETVSGFASTVTSSAAGSARRSRSSSRGAVNVGVPPPRKTVSRSAVEHRPLPRQLGEQRVDVRRVLIALPDDGDEVAVPAAVRAEREVDVQMPDAAHDRFRSVSRLSTARNASCGTSTLPTCFIRFLPFFCFSSSLRLRVMSPP